MTRSLIKNYFLIIFLILISEDTLLFGTNNNQIFIIGKYVLYVFFILYSFVGLKISDIKRSSLFGLKIVCFLSLLVLSSSIYNNDFMTGNALALLTLVTGLIYTRFIKFETFSKYFINVVYFLSICSLFIYCLNIFVPAILGVFPVIVNYGEVPFRFAFISNVFLDGNQFRNPGIFREPGVFAIYLNVALMFMFFINKEKSMKKGVVISLALFSTLSTAGMLVFFLILLLYFFKERSFRNFFISIASGCIIAGIFVFFPSIYDGLFAKLNSSDKDYLSSLSRIASFLVPIEIFKENPVVGVGLTNFVTYYEAFSYSVVGYKMKADSTSTNTFLNTFAIFGAIYGIVILRFYYKFCTLVVNKYAILLLVIFFVMYSSQDLRYSFLYLTLLSYGIMYKYQKHFI